MSWDQPFVFIADYMRPYSREIALAMVATLLVIFGDTINDLLRRLIRSQPVWLRVAAFVALCTFGYGALSIWLTPMLHSFLTTLTPALFVSVVVGGFFVIGLMAERYNK